MAYQLASHDPVYRKELASSAKSLEANQVIQLWDALFSNSYRGDSTFFILLGGAEWTLQEDLKQLLNVLADLQKISDTMGRFRLRILFSARDETVGQITNNLNKGISTIDVSSKIKDDIKSHEMLHVPEYDEDKLKNIEENVMVGQEVMAAEDWIQRIKQDWGLSTE